MIDFQLDSGIRMCVAYVQLFSLCFYFTITISFSLYLLIGLPWTFYTQPLLSMNKKCETENYMAMRMEEFKEEVERFEKKMDLIQRQTNDVFEYVKVAVNKEGYYCDVRGSKDLRPDPLTQQCTCKSNVQGRTCGERKANTFFLDIMNPDGCISCFCMGMTEECTSTSWFRTQISSSFKRDRQDFILTDTNGRHPLTSGFTIDTNERELIYRNSNNLKDATYYWNLPSKFLGNKVTSYGGSLSFVLFYRPGSDSSSQSVDVPLVEIKGNSVTLMHHTPQTLAANKHVPYKIKFDETNWVKQNGQSASREDLLEALADLDSMKIRATFTKDTDQSSIRDVIMDIAENRVTIGGRAFSVEQCRCPVGYTGLSCEDCDTGYTRALYGRYLALCKPCECNGHSMKCDPETGVCKNCQHNTKGDRCEQCSAGYYGYAEIGTSSDCQPCPCPLTLAVNRSSPTCMRDRDGQVTCTSCAAGHTGRRCERCIQGYSGNPLQIGDYCKIDTDK